MKWKLIHRNNHECIENKGGKILSYNPNLGIQIIEQDGFAFKDLNNNGTLDPYEDWRLPLTERIKDFSQRFILWQENDCLYYRKGKIEMPVAFCNLMEVYHEREEVIQMLSNIELENIEYLKDNYILALLLLMFDNDYDTGKEDYLLQLIVQSMNLGLFENIVYSLWEALKKYVGKKNQLKAKQLLQ